MLEGKVMGMGLSSSGDEAGRVLCSLLEEDEAVDDADVEEDEARCTALGEEEDAAALELVELAEKHLDCFNNDELVCADVDAGVEDASERLRRRPATLLDEAILMEDAWKRRTGDCFEERVAAELSSPASDTGME